MAFESLQGVLNGLETQASWQKRRQFREVLQQWPDVVGMAVAAHTRPHSIQRGVLSVATASSAWAQNLLFERQRILQKLNQRLVSPLSDIRFSTGNWATQTTGGLEGAIGRDLWDTHPSRIPQLPAKAPSPQPTPDVPQDANAAFQQWATRLQQQTRSLPLCPQCQCPTPSGELERWTVCALCATKQW